MIARALMHEPQVLALDAPAALVRALPGSTTLTLSLEFAESAESLPALAVMVLGAFVGSAVGMVVGAAVSPGGINVVFTVVLTPLMFTGATQFPWPSLDRLPWFQIVCAVNPLTYVSEGMRAVMVPQIPHLPLWLCLLVLAVAGAVAAEAGMRGFGRRAVD
ncbi:ABC transporter permease [Microtetraspora malaysiensis]|uniref:ABC transporter permease n=1 Tax=Microtetraspora malaysiensis TaxID=161358 RepID=UPI003D8ACD68